MLRGTLVKVNDKEKVAHLRGTKGIAIGRTKAGYIKVLSTYDGYLIDLAYPEANLEVLELPVEL